MRRESGQAKDLRDRGRYEILMDEETKAKVVGDVEGWGCRLIWVEVLQLRSFGHLRGCANDGNLSSKMRFAIGAIEERFLSAQADRFLRRNRKSQDFGLFRSK